MNLAKQEYKLTLEEDNFALETSNAMNGNSGSLKILLIILIKVNILIYFHSINFLNIVNDFYLNFECNQPYVALHTHSNNGKSPLSPQIKVNQRSTIKYKNTGAIYSLKNIDYLSECYMYIKQT